MRRLTVVNGKIKYFLAAAMMLTPFVAALQTSGVSAATAGSEYSYTLDGSSTTIVNAAAGNASVDMTLQGDWSASTGGVHFEGNQTDKISVGYAKPSTGATMSAPDAFGGTVAFTYQAPATGSCYQDSRNLLQVGRAGAGLSQLKFQLSNCAHNASFTTLQCRVAGSLSSAPSSAHIVTSTVALQDGESYVARCVKDVDAGNSADVTLEINRVDTGVTTTTTDTVPATGAFSATGYVSVANKYKLPTISANTDQFLGDVAKVALCKAVSAQATDVCLETEIPFASPPAPVPTQWIGNQSIETDLSGWEGAWGAASLVSVTRSSDAAYEGSYSVKTVSLPGAVNQASGFKDDPRWVSSAAAGTVYSGSVWVKPGSVGQKITYRIRELTPSGAIVTSEKVSVIAASTNWQQLATNLTAAQTGTSLSISVYADGMYAGDYFYADNLSLTTN